MSPGNGGPGLLALMVRPGHPDFLDLPWDQDLAQWPACCARLVQLPRGLSRHEVQFVSYGAALYAVKELPEPMAEREYGLLLQMQEKALPTVAPVAHAKARRRSDGEVVSLLITRYLDGSHPYRSLFQSAGLERYQERLLDALAGLLVRLHLAGVYWGDCSLSNILFRRDAGELGAYLVDAETSEIHPTLSDGQRRLDLMIMGDNVGGDLLDISMVVKIPESMKPEGIGEDIRRRYEALWAEATRELIFAPDERWRINQRVRALNELGFSISELTFVPTGEGDSLRMRALVTDRDYHRHQLHDLTGLVAQERQAQLMLNDIQELRARLSREQKHPVPLAVAAFQWQAEVWEPALKALEPLLARHPDPAELYCQVLEHKWFLSERARRDVGLEAALADYLGRFGKASATP